MLTFVLKYIICTNEDIVTMPVHVEKVRVFGSFPKCRKLLIDSMELALPHVFWM